MINARPESFRSNRRAYVLIELVVASFLTVQMGMVLVLTWKAFGVSALQVEERARLTVNANLAAESITRDWCGYQIRSEALPSPYSSTQVDRLYKFLPPRLPSDANHHPYPLRLVFQEVGPPSSTITISYNYDSATSRLIRYDETAGTSTTVASHVTSLEVSPPRSALERDEFHYHLHRVLSGLHRNVHPEHAVSPMKLPRIRVQNRRGFALVLVVVTIAGSPRLLGHGLQGDGQPDPGRVVPPAEPDARRAVRPCDDRPRPSPDAARGEHTDESANLRLHLLHREGNPSRDVHGHIHSQRPTRCKQRLDRSSDAGVLDGRHHSLPSPGDNPQWP